MACGAGLPTLAAALSVGHILILPTLNRISPLIPGRKHGQLVTVTYADGRGVLREFLRVVGDMGASFVVLSANSVKSDDMPSASVCLELRDGPPLRDLLVAMAEIHGVQSVQVAPDPDPD
jgi:putative Mg2+ transporter-C (MgtC) family protein